MFLQLLKNTWLWMRLQNTALVKRWWVALFLFLYGVVLFAGFLTALIGLPTALPSLPGGSQLHEFFGRNMLTMLLGLFCIALYASLLLEFFGALFESVPLLYFSADIQGRSPSLAHATAQTLKRLPAFLWLALRYGTLIRFFESITEFAGALNQERRGILRQFIVPLIVFEDLPFSAAREKAQALLHETWGAKLRNAVSFKVFVWCLMLIVLVAIVSIGLLLDTTSSLAWLSTRSSKEEASLFENSAILLFLGTLTAVQAFAWLHRAMYHGKLYFYATARSALTEEEKAFLALALQPTELEGNWEPHL